VSFLKKLFQNKPYLAWFVKDKTLLSQEAMLENLFNYGSWQDYQKAENELGIKQVKSIFESLKRKKRSNLKPKTINFFNLYFTKYA